MVTHLLFQNISKRFKTFQHISTHFKPMSTDPETAAKMPAVLALRDALYTPSFRQFVADITGVNDLTDRVDCSINAYGKCFLGLWGREGREGREKPFGIVF